MDHEIEHDVDVGPAAFESAEPLGFDEERPVEHGGELDERGIEALEVTDGKREPAAFRGRDQRIGFFQRSRDRFLDERMHARLEARSGDVEVRFGRHDH